jgi:phosphatidylserine/phosphatidylglycerophosphate/cardiolipin synthase-like enzyme
MTANLCHEANEALLRPQVSCWRANLASRATLLVDGDDYFKALRAALLRARRQILIAGWDFDTRIRLPRGPAEPTGSDAAPEMLGELLGFLKRRDPQLEIQVVRWDYHWFYSDDRELNTHSRLNQLGIQFHDDATHAVMGCIHHKVVTIDGVLAFCGGIDLTHNRWDTCAHAPDDARRINPEGKPYIPVHDTQLCVSGPIAGDLREYLIEHWPVEERPAAITTETELWPDGLQIDFRDVRVGLARTLPALGTREQVREIEAFYLHAIASVERSFYMENQYFTSTRIAAALAERLRARPQLEGLLVGMDRPKTQAELHTMGYGRSAFCNVLQEAGVSDRAPLVAAFSEDASINLHSKLAVFDDRWLTVGSANLNRRSMGFDVECNLIIEATTLEHRAAITRLRDQLIAEHTGLSLEELAAALPTHGLARLHELPRRSRRLVRIDAHVQAIEPSLGPILAPIFDPESPRAKAQARPSSLREASLRSSRLIGTLLLIALIAVAALTGSVVDGDFSGLSALQDLLSTLLRG